MQRVIVTGGLGFIGSHVADAFLARGDEVVIIDSMVAAVTDGDEYEEHPRCTVIRRPIEDYLAQGGEFAGYDRVVHAASHVGPAGILKYQGRLGVEIVTTTQAVIDASLAADCQLVVFSSAEVYGRSGQLAESDSIVVPTNYNARLEYAIAKTLTEAAAINSRVHGLESIVVRPFNVAGARQSSAGGFVMPTFVQQALAREPLTVFAGGEQVRAFLAASDLARFMVENLDDAFAGGDTIFNIGNPGNATTIWNLAARTKELLGSDSEIIHADAEAIHGPLYVEAESFEKLPVLSAAAKIGWKPQASLDRLILETAAEYREHGDARVERTASLT